MQHFKDNSQESQQLRIDTHTSLNTTPEHTSEERMDTFGELMTRNKNLNIIENDSASRLSNVSSISKLKSQIKIIKPLK